MALGRIGKKLITIFSKNRSFDELQEDIEDTLIEGDIGALAAMEIVTNLQEIVKKEDISEREDILKALKGLLSEYLSTAEILPLKKELTTVLVLGVNGVGKTTTIAKLAHRFIRQLGTDNIILAAGDTFRAGAIEQLEAHGNNLGVRVIHQQTGADPGAVIYDALESGKKREGALILADTAGRMHNKNNLVKELEKIHKIISTRVKEQNYHKLLVLDATTGQNALQQAEIFHEAIGVSSIALTKYDSTARGGIGISISKQLKLPFSYLGLGEKMEDLVPFSVEQYVDGLIGTP